MDRMRVLACNCIRSFRLRFVLVCLVLNAGGPAAWCQTTPPATANPNETKPPAKTKDSGPWCIHHCDSSKEKPYDLKNQTYSGETVGGPVTIVAKNLNILRYRYAANSKITLSKPPDLWSELTSIANPQSTTASPPPAKAAPATSGKSNMSKVVQGRARNATPRDRVVSAAALAVEAKIQKAVDEATQATNAAADAINGFPKLKEDTDNEFKKVAEQVKNANDATDRVNAGGQELLSFLKSVDSSSTYWGIKGELDPGSKFMNGLSAHWPSSADISALKISVDQRKTILAQTKTDFDGKRGSLIAGLSVAQRDLYVASEALESFAGQIQGDANATNDQEAVVEDRTLITNKLDAINASNIDLNAAYAFLNSATATSDQMETAVSNIDGAGDKYKAFQQAQALLSDWQQQMIKIKTAWDLYSAPGADQRLNPNPFTIRMIGTCDYAFSSTKQTAITLTASDQLPDKSAAAPATVLSVTVECASPFNVSAGVAFSSIPDREYAIQPVATPPGSTTTTNQFALTTDSSLHPVVLGMVSARLCEPSERIAFHLSFGLAGSFKSQSAGGSSAEFLIGPSISFFRTMFITPGLYIGKKTVLADGFTVGASVPANVTTPPLQSSYKPAFGLAITFTKP